MSLAARRWVFALGALGLLATPVIVFVLRAGGIDEFSEGQTPPGQATYLMMRPAGHLAFTLVFFQIVVGSFGREIGPWLGLRSLVPFHRAAGLAALGLLVLHPVLFFWSRSLRSGKFELLATFFPNPTENYWERMLFVGALGLYALLLGGAAALWGPRVAPKGWRVLHGINYAGFLLGFWHAVAIGAETRVHPLPALYTTLAVASVVLLGARLLRARDRGDPASEVPPSAP